MGKKNKNVDNLQLDSIMEMASTLMDNLQNSKGAEAVNQEELLDSEAVQKVEKTLGNLLDNNSEKNVRNKFSGELLSEMNKFNQQVQDLKKQMSEVRAQYTKVTKLLKKK
ncbi:hypothetical protein GCM10010954_33970 [Halobacillus andaensis]|uniref:Uncharacterized protein n=1 Tax=Halobacillus andaensis TaxID=1176239 RepID=A0A917BB41_HALAA|nr:hypothetical protein [Halobacillus andaensis]MBP2005502.1 hypothetical protein [Halobacillus andaensis]GGF32003.1 hypothetical protein GCM10010954_33970 [Halobacillus andaensis]